VFGIEKVFIYIDMPIKISLSSGSVPTDALLIPDLEGIQKIANGDLGIADSIKKNFMFGKIASSGLDEEGMEIFLKAGGVKLPNELSSYKDKDSGRLKIPIEDVEPDPTNDKMGLKALEKTTFQTIFETQKPYLEAMMLLSETMVDFEDIIARVSGIASLDGLSLRPNQNPNSLYAKVNAVEEDLNKMRNLSKDKTGGSKFSRLTTAQKQSGIQMDVLNAQNPPKNKITITNTANNTYEWEILGTEYSTGVKIEGIKYETIYKDILENDLLLNPEGEPPPPKKYGKDIPEEDEKPPVIVFGHFDHNGDVDDITHFKWASWLKREPFFSPYTEGVSGPQVTKWYGDWEQLQPGDESKFEAYVRDYVKNRLTKKNNGRVPSQQTIDEVFEFIRKKLDMRDIIERGNEYCFLNLIRNTNPDEGLGLGDDSSDDVAKVTAGRNFMYLPKKINYKGREVFVNPEADYDMQIIKLVPTKEVYYKGNRDVYNQQLKRTSPLIGNYQNVNVIDALDQEDYETSYLRDGYVIRTSADPRRVQTLTKYKRNVEDTSDSRYHDYRVTYIIEGILRDKPRTNEPEEDEEIGQENDPNKKYYKRGHFFTAIFKFIDSIIDIAVDLLPQIKDIFNLFSAPHEFIFDIALEKVGDNFELLSGELVDKFTEALNMSDKLERINFVQNDPTLKKFVFIDETTADMKFLFDSVAMFDLMGFNFGIQFTNLFPKFIINENGRDKDDLTSFKKSVNNNFNDNVVGNVRKARGSGPGIAGTNINDVERANPNVRQDNPDSSVVNQPGYETVSIKYSTGRRLEGIDYEYIYITQEVEKLIKQGDELFDIAEQSDVFPDLDSAIGALQKYDEALEKDPNNDALKDRIKELKDKFKVQLNMIFKFIFDIVSMPIKVAKNVLGTVLDLFDSITLKTIAVEIPEFLTFKWLLKNFKPNTILEFIGIRFDPGLLLEWLSKARNGDYNPEQKFNMDQVFAMPFVQQLPEVNIDELFEIAKKPLQVLTQLFKFVEQIITGAVQFILDIINIDKVLNVPDFNISKYVDGNLSIEELAKLLNNEDSNVLNNSYVEDSDGDSVSNNPNSNGVNKPSDRFLYDIKLPNGEIIRGLNRTELDVYIEANSDIRYEFRFPQNGS
jgi:hypothetical protein